MKKTSVTISARGTPGSGKSTLLKVINELLHSHVDTIESIYKPAEHSTRFLLPENFAALAKVSSDAVSGMIAMNDHQREVIEKWNTIDKANTERIAALEKVNDAQIDDLAEKQTALERALAARDQAVKEMSELKARLHESEIQLARMRGYVDRVRDLDERQDEPLTTITERTERPPRPGTDDRGMMAAHYSDGFAPGSTRHRHWTSYGQ